MRAATSARDAIVRAARLASACAIAFVTAGCATTARVGEERGAPVADASFDAAGRLSARHRSEAAAANFRWSHRPGRDELVLASPLGQTLAELRGDGARVRLQLPDGRVAEAPDWETLTADVLGAPLPVRGLAWWIRGVGHPDSRHSVERDATGSRVGVLRQDGWEIVYDYATDASRPSRLRLSYHETEVRVVVDEWSVPAAP